MLVVHLDLFHRIKLLDAKSFWWTWIAVLIWVWGAVKMDECKPEA